MPISPNFLKAMSFTPTPSLWQMNVTNIGFIGNQNSVIIMSGGTGNDYNTSWPYWYPGSSAFCIETWVNLSVAVTGSYGQTVMSLGGDGSLITSDLGLVLANNSVTYGQDGVHWVLCGCLQGTSGSYGTVFNYGANPLNNNFMLTNTWYHIAMTRSGTSINLWVNGSLSYTYTYSSSINNPSGTGARLSMFGTQNSSRYGGGNNAYNFSGSTRNSRYTVGNAVYTSTFTPPSLYVNTPALTGTYFNIAPVQNSTDYSVDLSSNNLYPFMNEIPNSPYNYNITSINSTTSGDQSGTSPGLGIFN
jgi:Concanavalin A-like lectin/glucanases superfamily